MKTRIARKIEEVNIDLIVYKETERFLYLQHINVCGTLRISRKNALLLEKGMSVNAENIISMKA